LREPRAYHAVGVRDDTEANSDVGEGLQALAAPGNRIDPQRRIGEFAVDVAMSLVTPVLRYAALLDIGLKVPQPRLAPTRLDVKVDAEPCCGTVMRVSQHLSRNGALGAGERPQDPIRVGEHEHTAGIEEHSDGSTGSGPHAQKLPGGGPAAGLIRAHRRVATQEVYDGF
jgi:hypothetical protein